MISSKASVHPSAKIGNKVSIGDFSVVGPNVEISNDCIIHNNVNITGFTKIGEGNIFYPFCSIGTEPQDLKFKGEKSFLEIGNKNKFREYVNINRGTNGGGSYTKIGNNSLFMVNVHIGHDCIIGNNVVIANNVPFGGHCIVEDFVVVGGNSAVLQFSKIGTGSMIGGMTGIDRDVLPFTLVKGNRCYYDNLNLIGLKRAGYENKDIQKYKEIIEKLYKCKNLSEFINSIKVENKLIEILVKFLKEKNQNRDICRPIK